MSDGQGRLSLTVAQEKRRKSIERRMRKCLRDMADLAAEAGASGRPWLYYEAEGSMYAMHSADEFMPDSCARDRQSYIAFSVSLCGADLPELDCGAW